MAPRKKLDDEEDDASSLASEVLKPKTAKAKVTKPKAEKPKVEKAKVDKVKKEVAKKEVGDAKPKKEGVKKDPGETKVKKDTGAKEKGEVGVKEKVKAVNGEEAMGIMAVYLKEQNRPYSATEVSANLHGKVTKTVADKLLKEMEAAGRIMGKATKKDGGGQWVFWAIQDAADSASPEELASMDLTVSALKESISVLKATFKSTSLKLSTVQSAPTTAALASLITNLQFSNEKKVEKLKGYKEGSVKIVTKEELDATEAELRKWGRKRKARVEAYKNLEGVLLDNGCNREEVRDKAGIEEDTYPGSLL